MLYLIIYCNFFLSFCFIYAACTCAGAIYGTLLALSGLACLCSYYYRSKLRVQYDLPEAPCMDCLVHFCCETCALCQEYRELKNRGFDLSIGNNTFLTCELWLKHTHTTHTYTSISGPLSDFHISFQNYVFEVLRMRI